MKDTLPDGWERVRLDEVAEVRLGRQRSPDRAVGENMRPYVRAANVTWSGMSLDDVKQMDFSPNELETYRLKDGDILLAEASGSANEVGKPAIWREEIKDCCFQNTLIRVRSRGPLPEYLHLHFLADARLGNFARAGKGVGINHLGADRMSSWPIALPPLAEQKRIVAKLEELTARSRRAKEALDAVPPLLDQLRQSILAAAFRGDLTADWRASHRGESNASLIIEKRRGSRAAPGRASSEAQATDIRELGLPDLPSGWVWAQLGEIGADPLCAVQTGPFGAQLHTDEFVDEGVPVVAVGNLTRTGFTREGLYFVTPDKASQLARYDVNAGDVLFARSGATLGKVCVAPSYVTGWRMTGHILRLRLNASILLPDVAVFALRGADSVTSQVRAGIRGMTRPGYNTQLLEQIWVPIPPMEEQSQLVASVSAAFAVVEGIKHRMDAGLLELARFNAALLTEAFRGELLAQDPNDEPAHVLLERIRAAHENVESRGSRERRRPGGRIVVAAAPSRDHDGEGPAHSRDKANSGASPSIERFDSDTLHDHVFTALWIVGPLEKQEAARRVADHLRDAGRLHFEQLHPNTLLHAQLLAAIDSAVAANHLDRPLPNHVRAIKPDPTSYTPDDWQHILLTTLPTTPTDRETAIRTAAEYARDNLGLAFSRLRTDGHIAQGLRSAITTAIRRGEILRHGPTKISLARSESPPRTRRS